MRYCSDCLVEAGANVYCADCSRDANGPASKQAIASVIIAVPGLLIPILAGIAVFLGYKSMREISKGQSPVSGQKWAAAGTVVGGIGVLLWIVGLFVRG